MPVFFLGSRILNGFRKVKKIAVVVGVYIPGFRSGGPVKSVANMISALGDDYEFEVYTADRDSGMDGPYENVLLNAPVSVGRAAVFYCSKDFAGLFFYARRLLLNSAQVFYFNSFFSLKYSILPLLLVCFFRRGITVVLAPRGEFSAGALAIKGRKKRTFLALAKFSGVYQKLIWHASNDGEKRDIHSVFGSGANVRIATDLAVSEWAGEIQRSKVDNLLRVVFLSRICEMKNIHAVAEVLAEVKCNVVLDVYGPIEDIAYWNRFLARVESLPLNVSVNYRGIVAPYEAIATISSYDLFFLPTMGENFGHAIAEALFAGVPVLISDRTPWSDMAGRKLGWSLSLDDLSEFVKCIENCAAISSSSYIEWRRVIQNWAKENIGDESAINGNRELFLI